MDSAEELQSYIYKLQLAVEQGRQKLQAEAAEGKTEVGQKHTYHPSDSRVKSCFHKQKVLE